MRASEVVKLGRALGTEQLGFVSALGAPELRVVREAISATLFDDARPMLQRVAKASRLLPNGATASVGEKVFGPMLCAHVASLLAPDHALAVALKMPDGFLAQVAAQLDPRGAPRVVAAIPTDRVVAVAQVLVARGDHVTLGRFVDAIGTDAIAAVIATIPDELVLLDIATHVEHPPKLAELVELVPAERLRAMVVSADARGLWPTLLSLAIHMHGPARAICAAVVEDQPVEMLERIVLAAQDPASWPGLLAVAAEMHDDAHERVARLVGKHLSLLIPPMLIAARTPALVEALMTLALRLTPARREHLANVMLSGGST